MRLFTSLVKATLENPVGLRSPKYTYYVDQIEPVQQVFLNLLGGA